MVDNKIFIKLLKEYTNIDHSFIDTFFKKFKIGGDLDFHIKDVKVANYLNITMKNLRQRLRNQAGSSNSEIFFENVDYIKIKEKKTSSVTYMLSYSGFERIAMTSNSQNAETVRLYFIKLREFIVENQYLFYQSITQNQDLQKLSGFEMIYFFAVDEKKDFFKIGRTNNIIQRLRNYNTGRIKEIELKYLVIVKHNIIIEKCIGLRLNKNRLETHKEIFYVKPSKIKKIIDECYCKHVSEKDHENLFNDLSGLFDFYKYVKNKVNIKPFVIINK